MSQQSVLAQIYKRLPATTRSNSSEKTTGVGKGDCNGGNGSHVVRSSVLVAVLYLRVHFTKDDLAKGEDQNGQIELVPWVLDVLARPEACNLVRVTYRKLSALKSRLSSAQTSAARVENRKRRLKKLKITCSDTELNFDYTPRGVSLQFLTQGEQVPRKNECLVRGCLARLSSTITEKKLLRTGFRNFAVLSPLCDADSFT